MPSDVLFSQSIPELHTLCGARGKEMRGERD